MKPVTTRWVLTALVPAGIAASAFALSSKPLCQDLHADIGTFAVEQERWLRLDRSGAGCDLRFVVINTEKPGKGPLQPLRVTGARFGSTRIEGGQVIYSPRRKVDGEEVFVVTYRSSAGKDLVASIGLRPRPVPRA